MQGILLNIVFRDVPYAFLKRSKSTLKFSLSDCIYLILGGVELILMAWEGPSVDIANKLVNDGVVKKTSFSEFNELFDTHSW